MKVFRAYDDVAGKNGGKPISKTPSKNQAAKSAAPKKSELTKEEILQKAEEQKAIKTSEREVKKKQFEENVDVSKKAQQKLQKELPPKSIFPSKKPVEAPQSEPEAEVEEIFKTDIKKNDPSDPVTLEKLKGSLSSSFVNFSPKERQVIENLIK